MQALRTLCERIEHPGNPAGHRFALAIQILILSSLLSFAVSTLPNLSSGLRNFLWWEELAVVVIFTIEYLIRLVAAPKKWKYVFSFFGLIDLKIGRASCRERV